MPSPAITTPPQRWLPFALAFIAVFALALPSWIALRPPRIVPTRHAVHQPARIVPAAELPPVDPVAFQDVTRDDARAWNASVPFITGPNPAARPFELSGSAADQARAVDCMAAAMLYEAGDDPVGERAVGQVIINRARHPAFPKSICGVVFQGQERSTGCQFTFTCDGAVTRAPNPVSWERARKLATATLTGAVFAPVGYATHYHTDWVVPYWSASLDKVAAVHTHLFFRWTGWWGTPAAFRRTLSDGEPNISKLAAWSAAHQPADPLDGTGPTEAVLALQPDAASISDSTFLLRLDQRLTADQFPAFAAKTCGTRDYCKLLAWRDRKDAPRSLPATPEQMTAMVFSYLRDRSRGFEKALWNCQLNRRADPRECMKLQLLPVPAAPAPVPPVKLVEVSIPLPTARPTASATPRTPPPAKP